MTPFPHKKSQKGSDMRDDMLQPFATEARGRSRQESLDPSTVEALQNPRLPFIPEKREQLPRRRCVMGDRRGRKTTDLDEVLPVLINELVAASLRRRRTEKATSREEPCEGSHGRSEVGVVLRVLGGKGDEQRARQAPHAPNTAPTQRAVDSWQLLHATTDRNARVAFVAKPRDEVVHVRSEQRQGRETTMMTRVQMNEHRGPPFERNDRRHYRPNYVESASMNRLKSRRASDVLHIGRCST